MHEGMFPATTELILGLCFGIINLGLYIFWNLHNCKKHLDTCIKVRVHHVNCELSKFMGLTKLNSFPRLWC